MLFLKSILDEDEKSMVSNFFKLQLQDQKKGDWVTTCMHDLAELNVQLGLDEIKLLARKFSQNYKSKYK